MFLSDYVFEVIASIKKAVDDFNKISPCGRAYYPPFVEFELNAQDFGEPRGVLKFKVDIANIANSVMKENNGD
jgi:hypothetical protein